LKGQSMGSSKMLRILVLAAALTSSGFVGAAAVQAAEWTFLVYIDGDCDLEDAAIDDFLEMAAVGSDPNVNIVVILDRIPNFDDRYGNWTGTRMGIINPKNVPDTSWGIDAGEVNMGDPLTLQNFIEWGVTNFPASKYAVILWNHGDGWRERVDKTPVKAVCEDWSSGGDCLYMKEVRQALETVGLSVGDPDLVGFDACLMGMVEVAYEIRDHGSVMVGSEEVEPWVGWPYTPVMADLVANPSMSAAQLGTVIVDRYYQSYDNSETQAATDLTQMDALAAEIDSLAQTLRDNWDGGYGACFSAAQSLMAAIDSAVIHEQHGSSWPGSHGLAIYFPDTAGMFDSDYNGSVILFPGATRWEEFLQDFYASMGGSWVAVARAQSQEYWYPEHIDIYDFCERLVANVPDDLEISPDASFVASGPEGGPFTPGSKIYTLTNTGVDPIDWAASSTATWLDLSDTGGSLAPGAFVEVEVSINADANSLEMGVHPNTVTFTNTTSTISRTRDVLLRIAVPDYFTELFSSNDNDLDNQTLIFTPDGSNSFYSVCREPATSFPTDPAGGTSLPLGDDDSIQVDLTGAQVFLYGNGYGTFFVGSNGSITFIGPSTYYEESLGTHFAVPRISVLFDDLDPSAGGVVLWEQLADRAVVTWENVPEYGPSNSNNFQVEMFFDGTIQLTWLGIAATDGLAGLSEGGGVPEGFEESDLTGYGPCPCTVDFQHFARFAQWWFESDCDQANNWCGGADLNQLGDVNEVDLGLFVGEWLEDCPDTWPLR
jgi:hypothetical protein